MANDGPFPDKDRDALHKAIGGSKEDDNTQDRVIASAHTFRLDKGGRWDRLLDAEPWDLVIVDEAHHIVILNHLRDIVYCFNHFPLVYRLLRIGFRAMGLGLFPAMASLRKEIVITLR